MTNEHYVYVYIDPRNLEPIYYGKGQGSRREAHLKAHGESKVKERVRKITADGAKPVIRTIACNLTEEQALLVETALIWQANGRTLNVMPGNFASKFRPQNTFHRELTGFDSHRHVYFFNVGHGPCRTWEWNVKYEYVGAGQGTIFRRAIENLHEGDIVAAYIAKRGYVGVGRVLARAVPARDFRVNGKLLINQIDPGKPRNIAKHFDDDAKCEWMAPVEWIKWVSRSKAHFEKNSGLFASRTVRASLKNQPKTVQFIEDRFGVNLFKLADEQ